MVTNIQKIVRGVLVRRVGCLEYFWGRLFGLWDQGVRDSWFRDSRFGGLRVWNFGFRACFLIFVVQSAWVTGVP